jgi:hypothetical protein
VLAALIKTKALADPDSQAVDGEALDSFCDMIAAAVVEHVIAAAVVTIPPGVPVATTGTAAAQAGATTAPAVGTVS